MDRLPSSAEAREVGGTEIVRQSRATGVLLALGSQSEEALMRMCEDLGADMVEMPFDTQAEKLKRFDFVVGSGGANSVHDDDAPRLDPRILSPDFRPLFVGVCLSAQTMVHTVGGTVVEAEGDSNHGSYGNVEITVVDNDLRGGFDKISRAKMVHSNGDYFTQEGLPPGFVATAMNGERVASFIDSATGNIGFQFHPELSDAVGYGVMRNALTAAGINLVPEAKDAFATMVAEINQKARDADVLVGFSGGIDSNVVAEAVIASDVPPERIHILHLDMGINRTEDGIPESDIILARFEQRTGIKPHFRRLDPSTVFHVPVELFDEEGNSQGYHVLSEQTDSEMKRLVFSQIYGNAFSALIDELGLDPDTTQYVQGTLYPDVIESLGKGKVKTHHNLGPFFVNLERNNQIINPANRLFKGDMRKIGKERGFTEAEYTRQPFPGPGLIPRIICSDGEPILPQNPDQTWEQAKEIVGDEFGVALAGFQTVGQKGDKRSLAWPIFLTGEQDWEHMNNLMQRLGSEIPSTVNRVYYLTGDHYDEITRHMTPTYINEESIEQLQPLDDKGNRILDVMGGLSVTNQVPMGLMPTGFSESKDGRTFFFRPFRTPRTASFLTGEAVLPTEEGAIAESWALIQEMALSAAGIERVAYDLTSKPYGSTEAE